jgi:hypothetical protein
METIFLLALAAAIYPQLLAVVAVILTRPNPRPLLWACYLAALVVGIGTSVAILVVFRSRGTIAGESSRSLGASTYLTIGVIAIALAGFLATRKGRAVLGGDLPFLGARARSQRSGPGHVARLKARTEGALREGSLAMAIVVGALLAVPGPFDFLALGHLARGGYRTIVAGALIVAFALIKLILIEVPISSYVIDPDGTAARVARFSGWMRANKLSVIAVVVAVVGLGLIITGISRLG